MPTQAERTAASDEALISAAARLIAERGYERTTLAAIGAEAGYSRGLVTQRFGSKEGLLWVVVERMVTGWSAHALRPRLGSSIGVPALQTLISVYLDTVERSPRSIAALYALLREASGPVPALRARIASLQQEERASIAALIVAGQRCGEVRPDVDPAAAAVEFLGMLRGVTMQWLLDPDGVDIVAALTQYGSTLDRTLGVR